MQRALMRSWACSGAESEASEDKYVVCMQASLAPRDQQDPQEPQAQQGEQVQILS